MTALVIYKAEDGKLDGLGEKGRRAYAKFRKMIEELSVGQTLGFSYVLPRSPPHHKYFFAKLTGLFERQEQFTDFDRLMDFLKVGAGHVDLFPGQNGVFVAVPKSINWEKLEEQGFVEFHRAMNDFLWTPYAQAALWPHVNAEQRYRCIECWHWDFQTH